MKSPMPLALFALLACGDKSEDSADVVALPDSASAITAATDLVGGSADTAEQVSEDGHDLWEVMVAMDNGANLEVLLFVDSGALFEVKDDAGPFTYDSLDPLPGSLTYAEARTIAFDTVAGDQVFWEVKYDGGPYFYEFYVRESGEQLWEIKLWADSGEVYVTEAVEGVD